MSVLEGFASDLGLIARAKGVLAFGLALAHLDVCHRTAAASHALGSASKARDWSARSLSLAAVVAEEGPEGKSRVYALLSPAQAAVLLEGLLAAAQSKMALDGCLEVMQTS